MWQPGLLGPDARAVLSPRAPLGMAQPPRDGDNPGPGFHGSWCLFGIWLWEERPLVSQRLVRPAAPIGLSGMSQECPHGVFLGGSRMPACVLAWVRGLPRCGELAGLEPDLSFLCFPDTEAIWDAISAYIRDALERDKVGWRPGPCRAIPSRAARQCTETAQGARSSLLASWERNQGQICSASQGFGTP